MQNYPACILIIVKSIWVQFNTCLVDHPKKFRRSKIRKENKYSFLPHVINLVKLVGDSTTDFYDKLI